MTYKALVRNKTTQRTSIREITKQEAQQRVLAARVEIPQMLDCYYKMAGLPTLSLIYSVRLPKDWIDNLPDQETLLQYGRDNIPPYLTFGLE